MFFFVRISQYANLLATSSLTMCMLFLACSSSQLTPLFAQRGVSWCGDNGSLEANATKFVSEVVPTPHIKQFSLDSCTSNSERNSTLNEENVVV